MKLPSLRTIVAAGGLVYDMGKWFVRVLRDKPEPSMPLTERDVQIQLQAAKSAGPKGKR